MRLIAWLFTIGFALSGIAFRVQGGIPFAYHIGTGLLILAGLFCPFFWAKGDGLFSGLGVRRKDRFVLAFALLLSTPLMLPWPFWVAFLPAAKG